LRPASKLAKLFVFGAGMTALALLAEANAGGFFSGRYNGPPVFTIAVDAKTGTVKDIYVRNMLMDCIVTADAIYVAQNNKPLIEDVPPTVPAFKEHNGGFSAYLNKALTLFNRLSPLAKQSSVPGPLGDLISLNANRAKEEVPAMRAEIRELQAEIHSICAEYSMK